MEMPTMLSATYASSTTDLDQLMYQGVVAQSANNVHFGVHHDPGQHRISGLTPGGSCREQIQPQRKEENMSNARIVKVFIADPNENIPLDKRVLYSGVEKLTDLTDQELFFEIPIKDLLDKHNAEVRSKTLDKKLSKDREVMLEPARIRDLKMVVVNVATF